MLAPVETGGIKSPGAIVKGDCELPIMDAGIQLGFSALAVHELSFQSCILILKLKIILSMASNKTKQEQPNRLIQLEKSSLCR